MLWACNTCTYQGSHLPWLKEAIDALEQVQLAILLGLWPFVEHSIGNILEQQEKAV